MIPSCKVYLQLLKQLAGVVICGHNHVWAQRLILSLQINQASKFRWHGSCL